MEREGKTVLVAGGTGTAGRAHVEALVGAGYRVKATIRPGKDTAALVRIGAEPVEVDLRHPEAVGRALEGVDALVVAVLGRGPDGVRDEEVMTRNLVDGARAAGVSRLVYTSVYLADQPTGVPHFEVKGRMEDYVRRSGLRHTFLRPATFMEGLNAPWIRASVEERGVLASPIALDAPISYVSAADVARFGVLALEDDDLEGATLNLGGPEAVTYADLLGVMSELLGQRVEYQQIPLGQVEESFGPDIASMIGFFNETGFVVEMDPVVHRFPVSLTSVRAFLENSGWGER
jgi:NAD(P)H dehydrogenase (quinone)